MPSYPHDAARFCQTDGNDVAAVDRFHALWYGADDAGHGQIPGALNLMKPMFPVLFPKLLPMMLPKVMPVMLERVADLIPMPDYMRVQMPELMPKVMDSLMPHMIGDVVPLVTPPMIDYLTGKTK